MAAPTRLLKLALPLIRTNGFTRDALANSVLHLPPPDTHNEPLSDAAVSALFGPGDNARRVLINSFFDQGIERMKSHAHETSRTTGNTPSMQEILEERLKFNEPVLRHLPEAFALLASPRLAVPPIDPLPGLKHAFRIADEACYLTEDRSSELSWYARRASLAAIYSAAELHQITSPQTTSQFLASLLSTSASLKRATDEVGLFSSYLFKGCRGIVKSFGMF